MLELQTKKAKYAILTAKCGGIGYLFTKISQRIYRKENFIGLKKNLEGTDVEIEDKIPYSLNLATAEDIEEVFQKIKHESKEAIFDLMQRKWFYETGFHNCYIARTIDSHDICYMQWTISRRDDNAGSRDFKSHFPWLGEQEVQLEHAYTFEKYRGNKIMPSVMNKLFQEARNKGFKWAITYVLTDNIASLKGCYSVGFKKFEEIHRTKFLFSTRYERARLSNLGLSHHTDESRYPET